jgi:DNA-binding MarR family transcriptional regulator
MLDEREFELINIIGQKLGSNQRDLSRHLELSLGQTNMLIRRLVSKGYIRITQLDQRKVKYLLTPKGIAEKMQKSIKYTMHTINSIGLIRERVEVIVRALYAAGQRKFLIIGKSDLAFLVETVFRTLELEECTVYHPTDISAESFDGLFLMCAESTTIDPVYADRSIDLVQEIVKDTSFINRQKNR